MEPTVNDIVTAAVDDNPSQMSGLVNDIMLSKIVDAVAARKEELQQSMFSDPVDDDTEELEVSDADISDEEMDQLDTEDADE